MKDLVEREGLFYKKFTDVPFTGEEQKEFENGEKKTLTSVTTTTDSYWKKGPARTVKNTVLGFLIIRMGLLTQNSQEPIRTAGR